VIVQLKHPLTPCLWFDTQAEEAANLYCSVFPNSKITAISRFPDAGQEIHGKPGSVMVVLLSLNGQSSMALNGGPNFKFDEAVSFQIMCDSQGEVDYYWDALTRDGGQEGSCGWLKDKFGLSWQVVPSTLPQLMTTADPATSARVMNAFMQMKKFDIETLERAFVG